MGGSLAKRSFDWWLPSIFTSSSRTILTTCWPGESAVRTSSPIAFCFTCFDELLDDFEVDVGLEQRDADLAERLFHVFGGQLSFAAQVFEDPLQFFGQVVEHCYLGMVYDRGNQEGAVRDTSTGQEHLLIHYYSKIQPVFGVEDLTLFGSVLRDANFRRQIRIFLLLQQCRFPRAEIHIQTV